jgi:hypothetical protein
MKKRVIFILVWTLAFPLTYFILSMLMFAVIGRLGIFPEPPQHLTPEMMTPEMRRVATFGMIWAGLFWLSPVIALILGLCGVLPGTRRQKREEQPT